METGWKESLVVFVAVLLPPLLMCMMLALARYEEWMLKPPRTSSQSGRFTWRIRRAPGVGRIRHLTLVRTEPPPTPEAVPDSEPGSPEAPESPATAGETDPPDPTERPADAA
ncbi:hypothetical protein [Streptomyces iconiensis]|uniref:Secreted protein n=1 Tax=Streptomyces iconiensis TaxID=1384038 RepID=A0ABT7A2A2_9ACTN|nr:hypothetical protein [Streptomyces iconiensis]MDJ1134743.1 hypothetical protein [Streptomyces iconiensis]